MKNKTETIVKFLAKYNAKIKNKKRINLQEAKNEPIGKVDYPKRISKYV